ncbi:MAG: hypothetical protein HUU17_09985 [Chthonomonadales bacterium]|nr:hypothetical protein [Chthonomonadales bacterium]
MKRPIPAVKGTRSFYPEEMQLRTWLYATMRRVATAFGYQEYEAPYLEPHWSLIATLTLIGGAILYSLFRTRKGVAG